MWMVVRRKLNGNAIQRKGVWIGSTQMRRLTTPTITVLSQARVLAASISLSFAPTVSSIKRAKLSSNSLPCGVFCRFDKV